MTFLALILLGGGLVYIASALGNETLYQTLADLIAGKAIDWSGKAGGIDVSGGTSYTPGQGPGDVTTAQGYPAIVSEGGAARALHTAWNYCVESVGVLIYQIGQGTPGPIGGTPYVASMAQDMVSKGLATGGGPNDYGKTNFTNEQQELADVGVQTQRVSFAGMDGDTIKNSIVIPAIQAGKPVGFGLNNARALYDPTQNVYPDRGVSGHAILIEGYDAGGIVAAEPNSAEPGAIHYYTWDSLIAAGPGDALIPQ